MYCPDVGWYPKLYALVPILPGGVSPRRREIRECARQRRDGEHLVGGRVDQGDGAAGSRLVVAQAEKTIARADQLQATRGAHVWYRSVPTPQLFVARRRRLGQVANDVGDRLPGIPEEGRGAALHLRGALVDDVVPEPADEADSAPADYEIVRT